MPATWPSTVSSEFETKGFQYEPGDYARRIRVKPGKRRVRPNDYAAVSRMSGTIRMLTADWETLEAFHKDDLAYGVLPCEFPSPLDSTTTLIVSFEDPPTMRNLGGNACAVRIRFEVRA